MILASLNKKSKCLQSRTSGSATNLKAEKKRDSFEWMSTSVESEPSVNMLRQEMTWWAQITLQNCLLGWLMAASLREESTGKLKNSSESRQEMNLLQCSLMSYFGVILIATGVWITETKSSQAMVSTTEPTTIGKPILRQLIVGGMAWQECPSSMH